MRGGLAGEASLSCNSCRDGVCSLLFDLFFIICHPFIPLHFFTDLRLMTVSHVSACPFIFVSAVPFGFPMKH